MLVHRFMLNLRQLNQINNTQTDSDPRHFSRLSIDFRVPSAFLGNIGEPLDHGQSERVSEDDDMAEVDEYPKALVVPQSAGPVVGLSKTPREEISLEGVDCIAGSPAPAVTPMTGAPV